MPKKQSPHPLNRIRQWDDDMDDWDDLDDLTGQERVRKQPQDEMRGASKNKHAERRQRQKEWGRAFTRLQRNRKREDHKP